MTAGHTLGPWRAFSHHTVIGIYNNSDRSICNIQKRGKNAQAYAHLIAAAPDLLAELSLLVWLLEPLERSGDLNVPGLATLNGARAAIAKATGAAV